jgi:hypothetical protein
MLEIKKKLTDKLLFEIIERQLSNLELEDLDQREFIEMIVEKYLQELRKKNLFIPHHLEKIAKEDVLVFIESVLLEMSWYHRVIHKQGSD